MEGSRRLGLCPKCGSSRRERGKLYRSGSLERTKYRADDAPAMSFKKDVEAVLCQKCGYLELYVDEEDLEKPDAW